MGEILRAYRERRGLSIKDVASKLGLGPHFIEWIETGKYHKLPGEVYAKNFIKRYAACVGVNSSAALKQYLNERPVSYTADSAPLNFTKRISRSWRPQLTTRAIAVAALILVIGYVGAEARNVFSPPPLTIENPSDGYVSFAPSIELAGRSLPETRIQVNGTEMITDARGGFHESLDLAPGINTFTIVAIKKHGSQTVAVRNIVYNQKVSVVPFGESVH